MFRMGLSNKAHDFYVLNFPLIQNWFCGAMSGLLYFFLPQTLLAFLVLIWFIIVYILNSVLGGILYLANQLCLPLDLISFHLENFYWSIFPFSYLLTLFLH